MPAMLRLRLRSSLYMGDPRPAVVSISLTVSGLEGLAAQLEGEPTYKLWKVPRDLVRIIEFDLNSRQNLYHMK